MRQVRFRQRRPGGLFLPGGGGSSVETLSKLVQYDGLTKNSIYTGGDALPTTHTFAMWAKIPVGAPTNDWGYNLGALQGGADTDHHMFYRASTATIGFRVYRNGAIAGTTTINWANDGALRLFCVVAEPVAGQTWTPYVGGLAETAITAADFGSPIQGGLALGAGLGGAADAEISIFKAAVFFSDMSGSFFDWVDELQSDWSGAEHYWKCGDGNDDASFLYDYGTAGGWHLANTDIVPATDFVDLAA